MASVNAAPSTGPRFTRSPGGVFALALMATLVGAYANSFHAPFVFDDLPAIVENFSLRDLADWRHVLFPPVGEGVTVGGRPLLNLSFALNFQVGQLEPWGYRAFNVGIHACTGLLLFSLVRRTLSDRTAAAVGLPRFDATLIAGVAAALWMLHPLQTSAVTYIVQRAESLAAFFMLSALWLFARAATAAHPRILFVATWFVGLAGVLTKETAVVTPVLLVLFDRTFLAGTFRETWRQRGRFHAAMAAHWLVAALLVASAAGRGGSAGFGSSLGAWDYLLTQAGAIWHYLALSVWPRPLVFDYGVPVETSLLAALPAAIGIVALLALTCYALVRHPRVGFLGATFFVLLAPSSSFVPIASQTIAEHRMYLPLAALAVGIACALHRWSGRSGLGCAALAALALAAATHGRNADYVSELSLWRVTVRDRPENPRAHNNYGVALLKAGDATAALTHFREALRLEPHYSDAHNNIGQLHFSAGRHAEALEHFEAAVDARPRNLAAQLNRANALHRLDRIDEAATAFRSAIALAPASPVAHLQFGNFLLQRARFDEAVPHLKRALELDAANIDATANLAQALVKTGRAVDALPIFQRWHALAPQDVDAPLQLGLALHQLGRTAEAQAQFEVALQLQPGHMAAQRALALLQTGATSAMQTIPHESATALVQRGIASLRQGATAEAIACFRAALARDATLATAHVNLGLALLRERRASEALPHFESYLRLAPESAVGYFNYGLALHQAGRIDDARRAAQQALALRPDFPEAKALLARLSR